MNRTLSSLLVAAAVATSLSACAPANPNVATTESGETVQTDTGRGYLDIAGVGRKSCVYDRDVNVVASTSYELKGGYRDRFLTPAARAAGVRVITASTTVSDYGSQVVFYYAPDGNCLLWSESLTLQEFSVRLGLDPMGISPFYQPDVSHTPAPEEKK